MDKLCILCRRNTTYDHADHCPECRYDLDKAESRSWNAAIDKAVEAIHKVIEDTGIPQDFDMNDLLDIEHDIEEELKKLKEGR